MSLQAIYRYNIAACFTGEEEDTFEDIQASGY